MSNEALFTPVVPEIPQGAIDFAKAVCALAEQYHIRSATLEMRMDTGWYSPYKDQHIQQEMTFHISRTDGRGRPRTQLSISCDMKVRATIVREPDSCN